MPVTVEHATFEDWWEPFTLGVGPAGVYLISLRTANARPSCASAATKASGRPVRDRVPSLDRAGICLVRARYRVLRWSG